MLLIVRRTIQLEVRLLQQVQAAKNRSGKRESLCWPELRVKRGPAGLFFWIPGSWFRLFFPTVPLPRALSAPRPISTGPGLRPGEISGQRKSLVYHGTQAGGEWRDVQVSAAEVAPVPDARFPKEHLESKNRMEPRDATLLS